MGLFCYTKKGYNEQDKIMQILFYTIIGIIIGYLIKSFIEYQKNREDYLAIAAHQLRGPLTKIKWIFDELKNNSADQTMIDKGGLITKDTLSIVNDLFNNEFAVKGEFKYKPQKANLNKLINQTKADLELWAKQKQLIINNELDSSLEDFIFDQNKLSIAITNILDNAIRYSKNGGTIEIKTLKSNAVVKIIIKDTGIGIPKEDHSKLFTKFFRAKNARDWGDGSGLGLYIARKIVKDHGGDISVTSTEGVETEVVITIPVKNQ